MNILHVTPYFTPAYAFGGVVRSAEGMTQALAQRGHQITVLTTNAITPTQRTDTLDETSASGVRIIRVGNMWPLLRQRLNLSTPFSMLPAAREIIAAADVVHCHEFRTMENLLITPLVAQAGVPLVLSPHGTLTQATGRSTLKRLWDRTLSPALARRFRHVVALTPHEQAEVQMLWQRFNVWDTAFSVVSNGVNPQEYAHLSGGEAFRQRYGLGTGPVCLFMGRLHPRKGVEVLLEAFRAAAVPGAHLVIVGPDEGVLARIGPIRDNNVTLTGYLTGADRLAALDAADIFALPAVGEGQPMVVLEALAAGLPVILSPECYLPEIAASNAGLEVAPTVTEVQAALQQLLSDEALRQTMRQQAQHLIHTRFTWDHSAYLLEAVYQSLQA